MIKVQWMQTILYVRGLNSQGDDALRAGGLAFGPMHGPWLKELKRRGFNAVALTGFGAGALSGQIERAVQLVQRLPVWSESRNRFHLLGHSTGGLVARALAHELKCPERVISVVTLATPHRGSPLVESAESFSKRHPWLHWGLCRVNYDINQRLASFRDLSPKAAELFNQRYPDIKGIDYASVVFSLPPHEMGWPVRIANRLLRDESELRAHDGYVESDSQRWGQILAEMNLDHLGQIGFCFSLNPLVRRQSRAKFSILADQLEQHWRRSLHSADL